MNTTNVENECDRLAVVRHLRQQLAELDPAPDVKVEQVNIQGAIDEFLRLFPPQKGSFNFIGHGGWYLHNGEVNDHGWHAHVRLACKKDAQVIEAPTLAGLMEKLRAKRREEDERPATIEETQKVFDASVQPPQLTTVCAANEVPF